MVPGEKVFMGARQGQILYFCLGGTGGVKNDKIGNAFLKKLGLDLVVRSSR